MAYTAAQITTAYTVANDGIPPTASEVALINALAAQSQAGALSDNQVLAFIINSADNDVAVANVSYQFFTGVQPSKAGLDFLVNSAANPTDLNDPFYAQFNQENRYVNFAANLATGAGAGAAAFATTYGSLSTTAGTGASVGSSAFIDLLYEQIVGTPYAQAAGLDVTAAKAFLELGFTNGTYRSIATARGMITSSSTAAQIDIATKVVAAGELLNESMKADVGIYAAAQNNFEQALINGTAVFGGNLLTNYASLGGGTGSAVGGTGPTAGSVTLDLTIALDALNGGVGNDTFVGDVNTVQTADIINGQAGYDTFRYFIGAGTLLPQMVSIENVQLVNAGVGIDVSAVAGVNTITLEGAPTGTFTYTGPTGASFNITNGTSLTTISTANGAVVGTAGNISTQLSGATTFGTLTYSNATGLSLTSAIASTNAGAQTIGTVTADKATSVAITTQSGAALTTGAISAAAAVSVTETANAALTTGALTAGLATSFTVNANAAVTQGAVSVATAIGKAAPNTVNLTANTGGSITLASLASGNGAFPDVSTINIVANGAVDLGAGVTTAATKSSVINVSGSAATKLGTTLNVATINDTSSGTLSVTSGTVTLLDASTAAGGVTAVLSGAAAEVIKGGTGADSFTLSGTGKLTVTTGDGNDTVDIGTTVIAAGSTFDGGNGTDKFAITKAVATAGGAQAITLPTGISNFEILKVSTTGAPNAGDFATLDASTVAAGFQEIHVGASTAGLSITKLGANPIVKVVGNVTGANNSGLLLGLATDTAADSVNVSIVASAAATPTTLISLGATSVETINLTSSTAAVGTPNVLTSLGADAALTNLNIGGDGALVISGSAPLAHSLNVNASANSAGVSVTLTGAAGFASNFVGTFKGDTFVSANGGVGVTQQIRGGAGGDAITVQNGPTDILVYTSGSESLLTATAGAVTGAAGTFGLGGTANMDSVAGFMSGQDKIDLSVFAFSSQQLQQIVNYTITPSGTAATDATALAALAGGSGFFIDPVGVQRGVAEVHLGADLYFFADTNKNGVFDIGSDLAVKFVGLAALANTDLLGV